MKHGTAPWKRSFAAAASSVLTTQVALVLLVGCGSAEPGERTTVLGSEGAEQDGGVLVGQGKDAGYLVRDIQPADAPLVTDVPAGTDAQALSDIAEPSDVANTDEPADATASTDAAENTDAAESTDATASTDAAESTDATASTDAVTEVPDTTSTDTSTDTSPAQVPIWLQGDWLGCPGTLSIGPTSYSWRVQPECVITGSASWDGQLLSIAPGESSGCTTIPKFLQPDVGAATQGELLTLTHPKINAGVERLVRPGGNRERWLITLQTGAQSELRLCYDKTGKFHTGSYSGLANNCYFFSCGGMVSNATAYGSEYHLWTTCSGYCPCGGIAVLSEKSATQMTGILHSANCEKGYSLNFTGQIQPWIDDPPAP